MVLFLGGDYLLLFKGFIKYILDSDMFIFEIWDINHTPVDDSK